LVAPTGFGRVAHSLLKYLKDDYDITGVGVNYHGDPHTLGIKVYPATIDVNRGIYGENRVCDLLNGQDFDIVFIINDAWVVDKYLAFIKERVKKPFPKIVVYTPVDSSPHDPEWYRNFDIVTKLVAYTEFGRMIIKDASPQLEPEVIPHGVDLEVFHKTHKSRRESKEEFFTPYQDKIRIGDFIDSFIVLSAARNQPRKRLDITMQGFAKFARNKPSNVKLYMHCGMIDSSINVDKLAARFGIADRLIVSSVGRGIQTVSDFRMNSIFNSTDVGINTSMGEGWNLPSHEHAATGAIQLVPNHSSHREIYNDGCGVFMDTYAEYTLDNTLMVGKLISPDEVAAKLEFVYTHPEEAQKIAQAGYERLTSDVYNWKNISKQWDILFSEVL
jgi:glycosyltransferase involved in cell wall biosynthesis